MRFKPEKKIEEIHTVLGAGSRFEGKLFFEGIVRIDGYFAGEIFTKGKLIVGEKAEIKGTIEVEDIEIAGVVEGNIFASGKITLKETARLIGDIQSKALVVEEGAFFNGTCKMERKKMGESIIEERDFIHIS